MRWNSPTRMPISQIAVGHADPLSSARHVSTCLRLQFLQICSPLQRRCPFRLRAACPATDPLPSTLPTRPQPPVVSLARPHRSAPHFEFARPSPCLCRRTSSPINRSTRVLLSVCCSLTDNFQNLLFHLFDGEAARIEVDRVRRLHQGRFFARAVPVVALADIFHYGAAPA